MIHHHYDLVVIGSGPGGQKAAVQAAKAGKSVAIVERHPYLGGGCVHSGTLPSKSFRESVYRWSLGSKGTLSLEEGVATEEIELPNISRLLKRRDRVVQNEAKIISDQLKRNRVKIYQGHAKFLSAKEVEIESERAAQRRIVISADFFVIAVGARPIAPVGFEVDGVTVFDSNTILNLKETPKSLIVLGAGIIGCEYASMFLTAGTKVFLIDRRNEILTSVDREMVSTLVDRFVHLGMDLILEAEIKTLIKSEQGVTVTLTTGQVLEAEACLIAQGRQGNTEGLGLDAIAVQPDARGLIPVDASFRTAIPNVYAVGDVIGFPALASTSMEQGRFASCHAFGLNEADGMPEFYPYGIYTIPEISMVGKTEEELIVEKIPYVVGRAPYRELARGQIVGDQWGLLKILVHKENLKIMGVHIIGDNAADLIHIGQAVMILGGNIKYFLKSVFNYPTLAEAYKIAALNANNQILGRPTTDL